MIEYKGKKYSAVHLAAKLGISDSTFRYRVDKYGEEMAIKISTMPPDELKEWQKQARRNSGYEVVKGKLKARARKIKYGGSTFTANELADIFKVKRGTFSSWVNRYGDEEAVKRGEMSQTERYQERIRAMREGMKKGRMSMDKPLPVSDPDYELKNRIKSYRKMGWTDEEILIKGSLT